MICDCFYFILKKLLTACYCCYHFYAPCFMENMDTQFTSYTSTHFIRSTRSKMHIICSHIIEVRLTIPVWVRYIVGNLSSDWGQTSRGLICVIPISCKIYEHHCFWNFYNGIVIVSIQLCIDLRMKIRRFIECFYVTEINCYTVAFLTNLIYIK